ncbi:MAG TPA: hypothetical protein VF322_14890 [Gammaproteobacteria bacterium]
MAMSEAPRFEPLEQVYALNRLFLSYLQTSVRGGGDCLGLPEPARAPLLAASDSVLDSVAEFPRALFALRLADVPSPCAPRLPASAEESARHSLDITILLCAWNMSHHHVGQARFLLGLDSRAIQHLRRLRLADLPRYAGTPELLACALARCGWLWVEMLKPQPPEARRRLALVALQPAVTARRSAARA